ncbi:hypothetical protein P152DRAFT_451346 [Eremomyces bilateralis CBS 781.70]|uniref:LsmAD domain-containing protein n=1 Tax=Eremomyces bilateralis CBS 781.70 TaxID=1392243 RepID=A0A6G1FWU0_9PEZI|nr:uncharacterized protein P152DRAFT_451346 [Eremomyces bilateralis CBS 781.70]KAF1810253.1 hypothetical protein P152DRAFT_451346 [Eremomyces bilateralis CBS 781.70]
MEAGSAEKHANDRLSFLLASFIGRPCTITTKTGDQFHGIFSGSTVGSPESRYVLKMVKKALPHNEQSNGVSTADDYIGTGENHTMSFDTADVIDLCALQVDTDVVQSKSQNGTPGAFKTDADISGNLAMRERNLQRWEAEPNDNVQLSLDDKSHGTWDQFEANERLYGAKSDYDENIYTTKIDRSHPLYKQRVAQADRIAREIESSGALTSHVAEERGLSQADDGADEESKYSGVQREHTPLAMGQPNKYQPPARRAQQASGAAAADPAIISSQLAKPQVVDDKSAETHPSQAGAPTQAAPMARKNASAPPKPQEAEIRPTKLEASKPGPRAANSMTAESRHLIPLVADASRKRVRGENATATVELDVLDSFKQFSAVEKLRLQEQARKNARADKQVKLNDLKKFAKDFKLHTPIPQDLVPILAKDKVKQKEIVAKAAHNANDPQPMKTAASVPSGSTAATESATTKPSAAKPDVAHAIPTIPSDRQGQQRNRGNQGPYNSLRGDRSLAAGMLPQGPQRGGLSQRLQDNRQQHRGPSIGNMPHPIQPIPAGPMAGNMSALQSPSGTARFNVQAMEFRPGGSPFTPSQNPSSASSPRTDSRQRIEPRGQSATHFFEGKPKPTSDRPSLDDYFNPIKRMKKEAEAEKRDYTHNGGIPNAYRTPPVWDAPEANKEKSYIDMFEKTIGPPSVSPPHAMVPNGPMPHHHQLPPHMQHGPSVGPPQHTPQHTPRHMPAQPHMIPGGPASFDEHRMHYPGQVHPSPRASQPVMTYGGNTQAPVQFIPYNGMGPGAAQGMNMRPYPGGPQFGNSHGGPMGGHMMTQQHSSGGYVPMMNPQMQVYSPVPTNVYPHQPGGMGPGPNGYPSPRPAMMSHQGSQQGHQQPVMYMQANGPGGPMFPPNNGPGMVSPVVSSPSFRSSSDPLPHAIMPGQQLAPLSARLVKSRNLTPLSSGPSSRTISASSYIRNDTRRPSTNGNTPGTQMRGPYPQQPYGTSPHQHHHFPQHPHRGTPSGTHAQPVPLNPAAIHSQGPPQPPAGHAMEGAGDDHK